MCSAQDSLPRVPSVVAQGEATIQARPDEARVSVGVVTQAPTAQAAGGLNAKQTAELIAQLKNALGTNADIRTQHYSIYPNYTHPKEGRAPVISGYTANNTVEVRLTDLAKVGNVVDVSTRAGANNINGVQFTLRDEQKFRADALRQAAIKAKANADALAAALGLKVIRVLRVQASDSPPVYPMAAMKMARMAAEDAAVPTPMEPGTITLRATVEVTEEVGP